MSVYPRGKEGRFTVEFTFKGQRIKQSTDITSKREAKAYEADLKAKLREQHKRQGGRASMTLSEASDHYLTTVIKPRNSNAKALSRDVNYLQWFGDYFGFDTTLEKIAAADIHEYHASRLKTVKPSSVQRELALLKAVLNLARRSGRLGVVPEFPKVTIDNARARFLTDDEEIRLLKQCPPWLSDLTIFCMDTGARKGDALKLKWSEVIFDGDRGSVRFLVRKNKASNNVPMSARVRTILTRLNKANPSDSDHVFLYPDRKGFIVPIGDFKKSWNKAMAMAKIEDFKFHDLRHTFASRLVMKGRPILNVSKLLGHKSLQMTMRYAHLAPSVFNDDIAALDD
jgi:integrase